MYLDENKIRKMQKGKIRRIGRVTIERYKNSLRVRYSYKQRQYVIYYNPICQEVCDILENQIIPQLNRDILLGDHQSPDNYKLTNLTLIFKN